MIMLAALFCGTSVAFGAFAAHGLKAHLDEYALGIFQTAAQYQMTHGLALLALGLLIGRYPERGFVLVGGLWAAGILIFSGSLYTLALSGVRAWGAVTPIGGVLLLLGWLLLAVRAWRVL